MTAATDLARVEQLAGELMTVTAAIRRTVRRQIAQSLGSPLPAAQLDLLIVIENDPGIGVAEAARTLQLAGNSVSALVNQLVSAGLVLRTTDPTDRRAARLHLTGAAVKRIARWRTARTAVVADALEHLSGTDHAAIEAAVPALRNLLGQLRGGSATPAKPKTGVVTRKGARAPGGPS